jgi:cobalt-zinc-cadmium efflux system outer membrane protein
LFRYRRPLRAAALGLGALGLSAACVAAEPAPPFQALLKQAEATAPRLVEARAEVARAEGLARQAGALPNPVLGVEVENFAGSGPFRGTRLSETTATIGQTMELGDKRQARVDAGRAEVRAAQARLRRAQGEFGADLASAYAGAEAAQRRMVLAADAVQLAEEDARAARVLVEAGREADLRRLQALAAAQSARAELHQAQASRETSFAMLTALAGLPSPLSSIDVSLLDDRTPVFATAPLDPTASPGIASAQAEREAAERRLRLERAKAVPDVTFSVGARRFEEDGSTAMVAGVSIPLPLFDRNRGNVRAARAEVDAAQARLSAARFNAEAQARASGARIAAVEARLAAAREGERTADEAYQLSRLGYEGGKLGLVELLNARRALTEARSQTIQAAVERIDAQAALAKLAGPAVLGDQP